MYERDTNVQEISDTFRNVLSQSMDKYIPSKGSKNSGFDNTQNTEVG